jgi:hypothetical protein
MWMVNPRIMCRKHLLGEHVENHMFVGSMKKVNLRGYVDNNLLEMQALSSRHDTLVKEMRRRGYNHQSPFDSETYEAFFPTYDDYTRNSKVDVKPSLEDLLARCEECAQRHKDLLERSRVPV